MPDTDIAEFGSVTLYFGEKSGKYPDGNQVVVRGARSHAGMMSLTGTPTG